MTNNIQNMKIEDKMINSVIIKQIKILRKDILKLNQTDFAKSIGLSQSTIAGYENGKRTVSLATFLAICREHNVSEQWLLTGEGEPLLKEDSTVMEGPVLDCMHTLSSVYGLNASDLSILIEYMKLEKNKRKVIRELLSNIANSIMQ